MSDDVPARRGGGFDLYGTRSGKAVAPESAPAAHPTVEAIFDPDRDSKLKIPYIDQGDPTMYTPEMLRARESLRNNPGVVDAIKRLAMTLPWSDGVLSKADYLEFHAKLLEILLPKSTDEQRKAIQARDWSVDAAGASVLTQEHFHRAMFELADQWTTTAEPEEYLAFLNTLKFRLARMK